ncbi:hypothetical protein [Sphingomonas koreensis]
MSTRFTMLVSTVGLLLAGCAPSAPALSGSIGAIRTGAAQTKTESTGAFAAINMTGRDSAIEGLLDDNAAPSDDALAPLITRDTVARWNVAFDQIDAYLAGLQDLTDTRRSDEAYADLAGIGSALQSSVLHAKLPRDSASAFAAFGAAVQAGAERKAQLIMRETDPAFQTLVRGMGDLVSGPGKGTLSGIVESQWRERLDGIAADAYGTVKQGSRDERQAVIQDYGKALDARDAQLYALASLRDSLFALAEAHSAAAKSRDGATLYWIEQIDQRLANARASVKEAR